MIWIPTISIRGKHARLSEKLTSIVAYIAHITHYRVALRTRLKANKVRSTRTLHIIPTFAAIEWLVTVECSV